MKILISNTSDKPLYQQIKDQIKDAILKEELKQGDSLPSIRAFANDLKVSVLTIRRVYEELEQEGFVISQVGIGTSVSASNLELLRDSRRRLVEEKMIDMIQTAKTLKISKQELNTMMDILYEEDRNEQYFESRWVEQVVWGLFSKRCDILIARGMYNRLCWYQWSG